MSTFAPRDFHIDQSFFGPMVLKQGKRVREHYATLVHWIEAWKLDAVRQEEILLTPSIQLALRRSRENQAHWRDDWAMVRSSVVEQGICMYYLSNESMYGHREVAESIVAQLQMCRFSEMIASPLHQSAMAMLAAPRIAFLGHGQALDSEVSKRLRFIQRRYGKKWHLVHWLGRHGAWTAHDWALSERMPVTYVGEPGMRMIGDGLDLFARTVDHVVLFDDKDKKIHEQLSAELKQRGKIVDLAGLGSFIEQPCESQDGDGGVVEDLPRTAGDQSTRKKAALQPDLFGS